MQMQIVAFGAFPHESALEYVLGLARGRRVLFDRTASPQSDFVQEIDAHVTPLSFYPWPPENLRELALGHDVILVGGGNTANMLAVWRVHGFDAILREAWESGVVLAGWSAGMICWFEAGVTDSFSPALDGMRDGLGFLPGSACPHYDSEAPRRPVYTRLIAEEGFPPGIALDDAAGAHFVGTELVRVIAPTPEARGYRVTMDGDEPLPVTAVS